MKGRSGKPAVMPHYARTDGVRVAECCPNLSGPVTEGGQFVRHLAGD